MATSDLIANFIIDMLEEAGGCAEMKRSLLADKFGCVPSQINYVISTRFSPEHGYIVESRRGGGGFIRITRARTVGRQLIMHMINIIGDELDYSTAKALVTNAVEAETLSVFNARLVLSAVSDNALKPVETEKRDALRASILKQMLITAICE